MSVSEPGPPSATGTATEAPAGGLRVRGLTVTLADGTELLRDVDLDVRRGDLVAVTGASGAGKSTMLRALIGRLPRGCSPRWSEATLDTSGGRLDLGQADAATWQRVRRRHMRMVAQDAAAALTPLRYVDGLIMESVRLASGDADRATLYAALLEAGFPDPSVVAHRHTHTLSGGMAQRVGVAIALAARPSLILADEPTTALDPVATAAVLHTLRAAADAGAAVIVVTHDLDAVEPFADRVLGLAAGRTAAVREVQPSRTRAPRAPTGGLPPALELTDLVVGYPDQLVLDGVSLEVGAGEVIGLRGPSGAGKSTLLGAVVGLNRPHSGRVRIGGVDTADLPKKELRRRVQLVPQHPREALNPWRTAEQLAREPLDIHRAGERRARRAHARALLEELGLAGRLDARPAELSTGQCQRVCLARALVLGPRLLLADEPVSSLDPELAEEMLDLIATAAERDGAGVLLVSHDRARLKRVSDRVVELSDLGQPALSTVH